MEKRFSRKSKEEKRLVYKNFNGLVEAHPLHGIKPRTIEEVRATIRRYPKVRVHGSVHVFNDLSVSPVAMIHSTHFDRIDIDAKRNRVTIEAGVRLEPLLNELNKHGRTIDVVPATSCVSVIGAISTSAHGSHWSVPSMSHLLLEAQVVLADGTEVSITRGLLLRALRCGLGCLGWIRTATLSCVPTFGIYETTRDMTWEEFSKQSKALLCRYPWTSARVNPFSPHLSTVVRLARKVKVSKANTTLTQCSKSWYIEIELCFPMENLHDAVPAVAAFHTQYKKDRGFSVDDDLLVRFSAADDSLVGMGTGRPSVYVSSFSSDRSKDTKAVYKFMHALSDEMVRRYHARPHYGKVHNLNHDQMKTLYGDNYKKFTEIRNKLDPRRKFCNAYMDRIV